MKLRESGMPEEAYWESLFEVDAILDRLAIDDSLQDVAELGCGYGTFTLPVSRRIRGVITTTDIDAEMVARTRSRIEEAGLGNAFCRVDDVLAGGFGVPPESQDGCLLFNILHCEQPVQLFLEAARIVRPGGSVFVIHWRYDPATPRGPSMAIRPQPANILEWAKQTFILRDVSCVIDLPPWHYGIRFKRLLETGVESA